MDIKPPYGYQEIVPLTKTHRVALPGEHTLAAPFRNLTAVPLSFTEFAMACRDYPIAFVSGDGGKTFIAMAILGLENRQNLFASPGGEWERGVYVPAYVRRFPFCMTRVAIGGQEQPERIACVEKRAISKHGELLHDAQGEPLPAWAARRKLLFEFEADLARTEEMCRALTALDLLETFTMQAVPNQGAPLAMTGIHRVAEQRLHDLPGEKMRELAQSGIFARVYAHLISLNNFARLLDRRAAGAQSAATEKPDAKKLN